MFVVRLARAISVRTSRGKKITAIKSLLYNNNAEKSRKDVKNVLRIFSIV